MGFSILGVFGFAGVFGLRVWRGFRIQSRALEFGHRLRVEGFTFFLGCQCGVYALGLLGLSVENLSLTVTEVKPNPEPETSNFRTSNPERADDEMLLEIVIAGVLLLGYPFA